MTHKQLILSVGLGIASIFSLGLHAVSQSQPVELSPDQPRHYFEVGELAAARARTPDELRKAREILAMGVVLAQASSDRELASSCAIALAGTHPDEPAQRQRLWDLALMIDPARVSSWAQHRPDVSDGRVNAEAAECIRFARNAEHEDASDLLDLRRVETAIRRSAERLGFNPGEVISAIRLLSTDSGRDPCNGNYFDTRVEDGESVRVICRDHAHPIGTAGDPRVLAMLLAIELDCLGPVSSVQDWGGESAMGRVSPARDPDTGWLIERYGIDPLKPAYSNGRWTP